MHFIPFFLLFLLFLFSLWFLFELLKSIVYFLPYFWGAPFVPCPLEKTKKILKMLELKKGEIFYDLGSGDGRVLIEAAKTYGVKAVGVEINPILAHISRRKIKKLGLTENITVIRGDLFKEDISRADAIAVYLIQPTNYNLEKKLKAELNPDARIVSKYFAFKNLKLVKKDSEFSELKLYKTI